MGRTCKVVDTIKYDAYDEDSVDEFGEMVIDITENNFFGSYDNADRYAEDILKKRAGYSPTMNLKVKGNPALQLGDIISVEGKYAGDYKITGITSAISQTDGFGIEMTVEKYTILLPFILDESILDSFGRTRSAIEWQ